MYLSEFVFGSLFDSFWFFWFHLRFIFVHSINPFVFITSLYPVKLDLVCQLLYTCRTLIFLGSTVRLLHNFVLYRMLIILPVKVATDMLVNKTTPTAFRGSSHNDVIFVEYCIAHKLLNWILLYCFVMIWNKFQIQTISSPKGAWGANI